MSILHLDFETRSACDLRKTGAYVYAEDPSTDVWCVCYAFDDGPVALWTPGQPCPPALAAHVASGGLLYCHNANFERLIWWAILTPRYGWPRPALEQFRCTMVMAYAMALPGSLEEAAAAVGLAVQKDMAGHRLMLQMARPRRTEPNGTHVWWDEPEKRERLYAYCKTDVEAERALHKRVLELSPREQRLWFLDQRINDRGVMIDSRLCHAAKNVVATITAHLHAEMHRVTGGEVSRCSNVQQLMQWLRARGVETDSVAKAELADLLARDLPDDCRRALELRRDAAKTSTAKIDAMLRRRGPDGRRRGNLQVHGAGTGRWAARGAQLQNLPRPVHKDIDAIVDTILNQPDMLPLLYDSPLQAVSDAIRGMLGAAPNRRLRQADFSNIEGRVVAWLAGQEDKLEAFRRYDAGTGPDLYLVAAAGIYGTSTEGAVPHRQVGKVSELSMGYQGGPGAFAKMAGNYGLRVETAFGSVWAASGEGRREQALDGWQQRGRKSGMKREAWLAAELIKLGWRAENDRIVALWPDLEEAAMNAVCHPGEVFAAAGGKIRYRMAGSFLWCQLPSTRVICYPYPRIAWKEMPWDGPDGKPARRQSIVYKSVNQLSRKWEDKAFYGGLAAENTTQAVARDIMAEAMERVEDAGYRIVLTVHDEILSEDQLGHGSAEEFNRLMSVVPPWAPGLPISAGGWEGKRYRK